MQHPTGKPGNYSSNPKEGPMSESFRTPPTESRFGSQGSDRYRSAFNTEPEQRDEEHAGEAGKALLVGVLGGLLSAAGYLIYRRLPDEQKERLQAQARVIIQQRITEIRQNLNI
jgi:hypothetical protein